MQTGIVGANPSLLMILGINAAIAEVHQQSRASGFWPDAPQTRSEPEMIALAHSELSEALEAIRDGKPQSTKIPDFLLIEEELADLLIRVFDHAGGQKYRVAEAVVAKMAYNRTRPHKHGRQF